MKIISGKRWHLFADLSKAAYVLMKKKKDSNLKCAVCTIPVMRTAAGQVSDLHIPDVPVPVVMRTATQVSDVHFSVMFLCKELSGLFLTNKSERIMTPNFGITVLLKRQNKKWLFMNWSKNCFLWLNLSPC